jgi:Domain of unknown function (DUF4402)
VARFFNLLVLSFGFAALGASPVQAQSASAVSSTTIISQTTLSSLLDMSFGTVITDGTGGPVILDSAAGTRSCTGGIICSGSFAFATLYVTGDSSTVQVTYPSQVLLSGPGTDMTVTPVYAGGSGATITLVSGAATIKFGAQLDVNPGQTPGNYTGTFTVNVNYI